MATIQLLILLNFIQVWFQRPKIFKCVMKCILTTANTSIMLLYQTKRNFSKRRFLLNRWKNNNKKKQAVISWNQSMLITEKLKKMHQQTSKIYSMRITVNFTEMYWCQTQINLPKKCLLKKTWLLQMKKKRIVTSWNQLMLIMEILKKIIDHLITKIYKQVMNITANTTRMSFSLIWKPKLIKWPKMKN